MPTINPDSTDQNINQKELASIEAMKGLIPYPVMICGVSRKANTGNFETVDAFSAIALPIMSLPQVNLGEFEEAARNIADLGFRIVSRETGERYNLILGLQEGK